MKRSLLDANLVDAMKNGQRRWRAWCNDCPSTKVPYPSVEESTLDEFLEAHAGHDAGKVYSL